MRLQRVAIRSRRHPHQMPAGQNDLQNRWRPRNLRRQWHFGEPHRGLPGYAAPILIADIPEDPPPPAQSAQQPRCCPNSRSVNPMRCQSANTRRICRARTDLVDPKPPKWIRFLVTHTALSADCPRACTWSPSYGYRSTLPPARLMFVFSRCNLTALARLTIAQSRRSRHSAFSDLDVLLTCLKASDDIQ